MRRNRIDRLLGSSASGILCAAMLPIWFCSVAVLRATAVLCLVASCCYQMSPFLLWTCAKRFGQCTSVAYDAMIL